MSNPMPAFTLVRTDNPDGPELEIKYPSQEEPARITLDWWSCAENGNCKLQVGICGTDRDEASVWVRFNDDGSIHSVELDREIEVRHTESRARDEWRDERDKERTEP